MTHGTDTVKIRLTGREWGELPGCLGMVVDAVHERGNRYRIVLPDDLISDYYVFLPPFEYDDDLDDDYYVGSPADWAGELVTSEAREEEGLLVEDQLLARLDRANQEIEDIKGTIEAFRAEHAAVFDTQRELGSRFQALRDARDDLEQAVYRLAASDGLELR